MHAASDILAPSGKSYSQNSPVWRVSIAVLGVLLCLIGGQAILQPLIAGHPNYPDHLVTGLYDGGAVDLPDVFWPTLYVTSVVSALILLARGFGARLGYHWTVLAIGVVLMGGLPNGDIVHGTVNTLALLQLAAGLLLRSQNHIVAASLAFAAMISLQPFMGAVLIYFALRADWRTVRWGLGMGAAVLLASLQPAWPNLIEAAQRFISPPFIAEPDNQSAYGLFLRMFTDTPFSTPWIDNPALVPVFMALVIALAGVLAVVGLHLGRSEDLDEDARLGPAPAVLLLECSLIVALAMVCFAPTEDSHVVVALAGLAGALIVGLGRISAKAKHARLWIVAILAWALSALVAIFPPVLWVSPDLAGWEILASSSAIALLLAGAATAIVLWRERKAAAEVVIPQRPFGKRRNLAQPAVNAACPS